MKAVPTCVRLDGRGGTVWQVLEELDAGEGQVPGEQGHHLHLHPVRGAGRHGHQHHARALAANRPVATVVHNCTRMNTHTKKKK